MKHTIDGHQISKSNVSRIISLMQAHEQMLLAILSIPNISSEDHR